MSIRMDAGRESSIVVERANVGRVCKHSVRLGSIVFFRLDRLQTAAKLSYPYSAVQRRSFSRSPGYAVLDHYFGN